MSCSGDRTIRIWDVKSCCSIKTFIGHTKAINSVVYSPCGKYIASGSSDKTIKIWNIDLETC